MCRIASTKRFANASEEELVNLTLAVSTINVWNRLCISFRVVPGTYQPKAAKLEPARA